MDATTALMFDRLREAQLRQGEALREILRLQREILTLLKKGPSSSNTPSASKEATLPHWQVLLRPALTSAGQWAGGILAMAYVARGGDAGTALQMLLKLFG